MMKIAILVMTIGLAGIIINRDRLKQILSLNVMSLGIVLFFVAIGAEKGSFPPLKEFGTPVDPLPAVLMLTTLVVDVAVTALALGLVMRGDGA
ncbi:cation:proton antiporter subunit C [Pyrococcus yayanosii]|uniref:Putative monovalent cation/H+ antiporter subunit C n=1 Tax=Pyrococcus yayanosii (strain CH1 / JCM 16557) TaxID=529709 RepID=F8AIT9_PYRYC|nr:cation:proton antiporter subunit C [Pyrococcus yayanosii]AEH24321.1 putative monovalent cation/H+ antiporter subunit C [Pyrococcus yayanosii CH1]